MSAKNNEDKNVAVEEATVPQQNTGGETLTEKVSIVKEGDKLVVVVQEDEDGETVSKLKKLTELVTRNKKAIAAFGVAAVCAAFALKQYNAKATEQVAETPETEDDTSA
jgi:hypothetical protein